MDTNLSSNKLELLVTGRPVIEGDGEGSFHSVLACVAHCHPNQQEGWFYTQEELLQHSAGDLPS
eukprot:1899218-Amphidinium_carterae.1